jgi:hypothetical protein
MTMSVLGILLGVLPMLAALLSVALILVVAAVSNRRFAVIKKKVAKQTDGRATATQVSWLVVVCLILILLLFVFSIWCRTWRLSKALLSRRALERTSKTGESEKRYSEENKAKRVFCVSDCKSRA